MDLFEKINRAFGTWYEGLFGGGDDVRPKDILRRILTAMEDNRKEGVDNKTYVPNQYVLEISVDDEEEKDYLLSFLDRDELEAAIRRYCQQNHYHVRGSLDFTIKEINEGEIDAPRRSEKVRVRCRYNSRVTGPADPRAHPTPEPSVEERTVASAPSRSVHGEETGTVPSVAAATLVVYAPDRTPFRFPITRAGVSIGRSQRTGNDLVIETDGQISKRHARVEQDSDGRFTVYDLDSTNGVKVNGRRISNRTLHDGDEVVVGVTRLMFQQATSEDQPVQFVAPRPSEGASRRPQPTFGGAAAVWRSPDEYDLGTNAATREAQRARLVLIQDGQDVDDYLLASESVIGRAITNDIVLPDRSVGTRHARIINNGDGYRIERLDPAAETLVNGEPIGTLVPTPISNGDRIGLGKLQLRFESGD